jgi:hypothetical protein
MNHRTIKVGDLVRYRCASPSAIGIVTAEVGASSIVVHILIGPDPWFVKMGLYGSDEDNWEVISEGR